jgi:chromosome segregation ATPase
MSPSAIGIAARIAGAALIFAAGWTAQGWHLGEKIAEIKFDHAQAELANALAAGVQEAEWTKTVEDAKNDATTREQAIRRDAANARNAADSLQRELADIRESLPTLAAEARRQRADTLAKILGQCTAEYQWLAERADRHASDVKTLSDAWPK